ncbi:SpoIIE family protein phosphatase [Streptomyces phaeolivaceus]|uniref:SpoIIE family protein phosphatase n=1 Tax=Streptomyces phaeolivaceus TaxID=2653200 RepID=UPI00384FAA5A
MGHDLTAAAGMSRLHGILRSLAWDRVGLPGSVVDRLDDAMPAITTVPMATLVLARVEGHPHDGTWTCGGPAPDIRRRSSSLPADRLGTSKPGRAFSSAPTWATAGAGRTPWNPCHRDPLCCSTPTV